MVSGVLSAINISLINFLDVDSKGFTNVLGASTSPLDKFSTSANWIAAPGDPHPVYLSKQPTQAFILKEKGKLQAAGRLGLTVTPSAHLKVDSPANMLFVDKSPSASYGAIPVFDPTYGDLYNAYNITELVEDPKYYVDEDDVFESRLI